jgi:hypothetical protein
MRIGEILPPDQQSPERLILILYSSNQLKCMVCDCNFKCNIIIGIEQGKSKRTKGRGGDVSGQLLPVAYPLMIHPPCTLHKTQIS